MAFLIAWNKYRTKGCNRIEGNRNETQGVYVLEPQVFGDARGWFMESWSQRKMEEAGLFVNFVQDNQSYSAQKGTLRGLHYQLNPMCQAKLLRATRGMIFDVAVDIRKGSPQFGQWVGVNSRRKTRSSSSSRAVSHMAS